MLTLLGIRAIKLKERLINEAGLDSNDIFEVHPLTTSEYLALEHHKTSFDNFTRGFYELSGLDASGLKNVHLLDALLCAYTGYLDLKGQCIKVGDENEGAILVPVPKDIKCIFFDMDGTLTDIKSPWQMVFETLGIWEREGAGLLAGWLRGEYDYCEFCKKDTDAWSAKGLTEEMFLKILGNINIYKEAWEVLQYLSGKGIKCIIISTGFYKTAEEIAKRCNMGFEKGLNNFSADVLSVFANDIVFKDNQINALTDVNADNGKQGSKGNILKSCLKKLKTGNIRCLSAGDSRQSDKELFDLTADFVFIEKASDLKKIIGKIEG
jgi:phosphoserine phosphatase